MLIVPLPEAAVRVPPVQVVDSAADVATVMPVGRMSVKSRLSTAATLPVLSTVKISVVTPPPSMISATKALLKPGGVTTLKVAAAVPLEPATEVRGPEVLRWAPGVELVTSTETVHEPVVVTEPPLKLTVEPPATAVIAPPAQVVVAAGVAADADVGRQSVGEAEGGHRGIVGGIVDGEGQSADAADGDGRRD